MLREYAVSFAASAIVIITFDLGSPIDAMRAVDHVTMIPFHRHLPFQRLTYVTPGADQFLD
jgi:hypothetical protein